MFDKLIEVILQFIHLFQPFFVVACYEGALVLRFGKLHRQAAPGFHWKWPFDIERVLSVNVVVETATVGPLSLTTKDQREIVVSAVVTFQIEDVQKFLLGIEGAHQAIEDVTYGIISQFIRSKTWSELLEMDLDNELLKKVKRLAAKYGVGVINVQVVDFTRSRSFRLIQPLNHHSHVV